ncbi:hypothetical protein M9Y10_022440 [Tritrichomonas musculus]|uniref:Uncharacterized protein n=1 Tax=Tritrichomonas musculus TaxID=1915356 RepID=A0ABR2KS95_9EUKA
MIFFLFSFAFSLDQFGQENNEPLNQDSINLDSIFNNNQSITIPLIFMGISFCAICIFYFIHMKRIMKEITNTAPVFDLVDNEAKIDFTIAERHSG